MQDYPEHRLQFFSLLRAITNHCFATLFTMSSTQLKLVMDSIIWAFRHTERNIAETGLNLLLEMLTSFEKSDFVTQFHQTYYLQLIREIFAVMTGDCRFVLLLTSLDCAIIANFFLTFPPGLPAFFEILHWTTAARRFKD